MTTKTKPRAILNGRVFHRSQQHPLERAAAYARMLSADRRKRFDAVEIVEGNRGGWYVLSHPASPQGQKRLAALEQAERAASAALQGPGFQWTYSAVDGWQCFNPATGGAYIVNAAGCTCRDFADRCRAAGLRCKHQLDGAARGHFRIETAEEKRDRIQRDIEQDFCD